MQRFPLVIVRHDSVINDYPEVMAELMVITRRHPGCLDEIWLADGSFEEGEALHTVLAKMRPFREMCEKAGVLLSFQQGVTLGHSAVSSPSKGPAGSLRFSEDAWQVGKNGERLYGLLCPRSPEARAHQYAYVKQVLEELRPASYWMDDDLRLGISKDDGCFCDRCIAAFNARWNLHLTREELVERLFGEAEMEPLRGQWSAFNEESLALFAGEARRAADDLHSDCLLSIQTVWANAIYTGRSYLPLLNALAGNRKAPVGIRPGAGVYHEDFPQQFLEKSLSILREAERFRRSGLEGTVCNEEENYPRKVLRKSSETILIESALMLASGCDAMSLYRYSVGNPEPLEYYEEFAAMVSAYRPYCEVLSDQRQASVGGIARYLGEQCNCHRDFSLTDPAELPLASTGIPLTVAEANPAVWLVTRKTVQESTEEDFRRIFTQASVFTEEAMECFLTRSNCVRLLPNARQLLEALRDAVQRGGRAFLREDGTALFTASETQYGIPGKLLHAGWVCTNTSQGGRIALIQPVETDYHRPSVMRRAALLDAMDWVSQNQMPVRLETCHRIRILPRVTATGEVISVTLLNCSIGESPALRLKVRHPHAKNPLWLRPRHEKISLGAQSDAESKEISFQLPPLPGWQMGTLLFE